MSANKRKRTDSVPPPEAADPLPAPLALDRAFLADVGELLGPLRGIKATILRATPDLARIDFGAIDAGDFGDALGALEAKSAPLLDRVLSTLERCVTGRAGDDAERLQCALAGARIPLDRDAETLDRVEEWIGALQLFETRSANELACTHEAIAKKHANAEERAKLNRRKQERERVLEEEEAAKLAAISGPEDDGSVSIDAYFRTSIEGKKEGDAWTSLRINAVDLVCPDGAVVPLSRRATDQEIERERRARAIVELAQKPANEEPALDPIEEALSQPVRRMQGLPRALLSQPPSLADRPAAEQFFAGLRADLASVRRVLHREPGGPVAQDIRRRALELVERCERYAADALFTPAETALYQEQFLIASPLAELSALGPRLATLERARRTAEPADEVGRLKGSVTGSSSASGKLIGSGTQEDIFGALGYRVIGEPGAERADKTSLAAHCWNGRDHSACERLFERVARRTPDGGVEAVVLAIESECGVSRNTVRSWLTRRDKKAKAGEKTLSARIRGWQRRASRKAPEVSNPRPGSGRSRIRRGALHQSSGDRR